MRVSSWTFCEVLDPAGVGHAGGQLELDELLEGQVPDAPDDDRAPGGLGERHRLGLAVAAKLALQEELDAGGRVASTRVTLNEGETTAVELEL